MNRNSPIEAYINENTNKHYVIEKTLEKFKEKEGENILPRYTRMKYSLIFYYTIIILGSLFAIFYSFVITPLYTTKYFWILIISFTLYIPLSCVSFFFPFIFYRLMGRKVFISLLMILDTLFIISNILCYIYRVLIPFNGLLLIVFLVINTFAIKIILEMPFWIHLYLQSIETIYKYKTKLFKALFKQNVCLSFVTYWSITSIIMIISMLFNYTDNRTPIDLFIIGITICLLIIISWHQIITIKHSEIQIYGILFYINNYYINRSGINNNKIDYDDYNNYNSYNYLNYNVIGKTFKEFRNKEIQKIYYTLSEYLYTFKYGSTPQTCEIKNPITISKDLLLAIEKSDLGFPLHIFNNMGIFIYSLFSNIDMKQATNECFTSIFNNGYLEMINDCYSSGVTSITTSIIIWSFGCLMNIIIFFYIVARNKFDIEIIAIVSAIDLIILSCSFVSVGLVNSLILGYSESLRYLYIGRKIEIGNDINERNFKLEIGKMSKINEIE